MVKSLKFDRNTGNRFMKVSAELPNSDMYHTLGSNVLHLITTLPEPECTKEHIISNGENKTPDEKTIDLTQNSILRFVKLHKLVIVMLFTGII
ncbi:TPA: hypothetical protein ACK0JT_002123 [Staphylococcus aureus]